MPIERNPDEPAPDNEQDREEEPKPAFCWDRLKAECNPFQDWFLKQHPAHDQPIDISTSFAPEGWQPLFYKLMATSFVVGTAIFTFVKEPEGQKWWWFASATNWFQFTGSLYLILSLYNTLFGASQPYRRVSSYVVKATWLIYSFTSHFGILNAIFWWLFVYEPGRTLFDWKNIVPHTVMPFTVTFDGTSVNRIPLRWQHYWGFVVPMEMAYIFWTFIQNFVAEIDNPNYDIPMTESPTIPPTEFVDGGVLQNGTLTNVSSVVNATNATQEAILDAFEIPDDDAIYEVYNWQDNASQAILISVVGIFGIGPFVFFIQWLFTQYWIICICAGERRLYYADPRKRRPKKAKFQQGAGLEYTSGNAMASSDEEEEFDRVHMSDIRSTELEEEKQEETAASSKKYRNKFEELAMRGKTEPC